MTAVMKSEYIKLKHSFSKNLLWLAPLTALLLCSFLIGETHFQISAYNWWYMFLLPGVIAVFCGLYMQKDKKMKFHNMLAFSTSPRKIWTGKLLIGLLFLLIVSTVFFAGLSLWGFIFQTGILLSDSLLASIALFLTFAWQIPLCMFLSARIGILGTVLINLFGSFGFSVLAIYDKIWLIPYAIPARLMCPMLELAPNGIPLKANSPLLSADVIVPGLIVSILFCIVLFVLTSIWANRQEAL